MQISDLRDAIDVGVITVKEEEFTAVLSRLNYIAVMGGRHEYQYSTLTAQDGSMVNIVVARTLEQGAGPAQSLAHDLIEDLAPHMLVLVGIAGGIPAPEYSLGDVILASRLYDFSISAAKAQTGRQWDLRGGGVHPAVRKILEAIPAWKDTELSGWNANDSVKCPRPIIELANAPDDRFYGDDNWNNDVLGSLRQNIEMRRSPLYRVGPAAAGNTLVMDDRLADVWKNAGGRAIHDIEMELSGVYEACWRDDKIYPVLAIRGLSDIVGFNRSPEWIGYACHTAAAFAIKLLLTGRIKRGKDARRLVPTKAIDAPTIVKIAIFKSNESVSPEGHPSPTNRADTLTMLSVVAGACFPQGTRRFPDGSFYKPEGDAVYFVLEKPSVALRGAIEFMQRWHHQVAPEYQECRAFLARGPVEVVELAGGTELYGKPFEIIAEIDKKVDEAHVYLTQDVADAVDQTMAKFRFKETISLRQGAALRLYAVDFLDPKTVPDSSLLHALFVAHPRASEARDRLFELFVLEYLLDHGALTDFHHLETWAKQRGYPLPDRTTIRRLLHDSSHVEELSGPTFKVRQDAARELNEARQSFAVAQEECLAAVQRAIVDCTGRADAVDGLSLETIVEDYLCAIFAEVRMMANYFRSTLHLFESGTDQFAKFDYVVRRNLDEERRSYFKEWRTGFIQGLKGVSETPNAYIAAVFHNVLATYYLNRSAQVSAYQEEKLRTRQIVLDTNVLYSLLVPASGFHEITRYFVVRLAKIGIPVRIAPITLVEYEEALGWVQKNWDAQGPREVLITRNPWIYQEYMHNQAQFLQSFQVCRQTFSIAKDLDVTEENFDELDARLQQHGVRIERGWFKLADDEVEEKWIEDRNAMTSNRWSAERYWEFISKDVPLTVKRHDMTCIANLVQKAAELRTDALGPQA